MEIKVEEQESKKNVTRLIDKGYATPTRIFQVHHDNEPEPVVIILINAGKDVNGILNYYHVIQEDAFGYEPNGNYSLMREDELEKRYNIKINADCESELLNEMIEHKLPVVSVAFSQSLHIINVTEETFEKICPFIADHAIDADFLSQQRFFHVMTTQKLITFQKIQK